MHPEDRNYNACRNVRTLSTLVACYPRKPKLYTKLQQQKSLKIRNVVCIILLDTWNCRSEYLHLVACNRLSCKQVLMLWPHAPNNYHVSTLFCTSWKWQYPLNQYQILTNGLDPAMLAINKKETSKSIIKRKVIIFMRCSKTSFRCHNRSSAEVLEWRIAYCTEEMRVNAKRSYYVTYNLPSLVTDLKTCNLWVVQKRCIWCGLHVHIKMLMK